MFYARPHVSQPPRRHFAIFKSSAKLFKGFQFILRLTPDAVYKTVCCLIMIMLMLSMKSRCFYCLNIFLCSRLNDPTAYLLVYYEQTWRCRPKQQNQHYLQAFEMRILCLWYKYLKSTLFFDVCWHIRGHVMTTLNTFLTCCSFKSLQNYFSFIFPRDQSPFLI